MDKIYSRNVKLIENNIKYYISNCRVLNKKLLESVEYSLFSTGKFIRPLLVLDFCSFCKGDLQSALPLASAVEMVHTYSLIHDDLPCMDNDSTRRGKPSNHIANGEDFAVLAGDSLLSLAFEVLSNNKTVKILGEATAIKAVEILSNACGISGMTDGQAMDISYKNCSLEFNSNSKHFEYLKNTYFKKTGKLISASCALGCLAAGAPFNKTSSAKLFGENIGVAYQILDDLKDKDLDSNNFFYNDPFNKSFAKNKAKDLLEKSLNILENEFNLTPCTHCFAKDFIKKLKKDLSFHAKI